MQSLQAPEQTIISRINLPGIQRTWGSVSILAAITIGAGLRLYFYQQNRSLWFDEAMLALNLVARDFAGLLQPLDYTQGAPVGFLLLQKTMINLFGNHDYVLRLLPLLCGLASLPLFYLAVRKYSGHTTASAELGGMDSKKPGGRQKSTDGRQKSTDGRQKSTGLGQESPGEHLAVWLFALSPQLIYYSSECKQYAGDVLIAVFLFWLARDYFNGQNKDRSLILTGISGALALWFSHPSLFIVSGLLLVIGLDCLVQRDWPRLGRLLMIAALGAVSLGLNYLVSLQHLAANPHLNSYWQEAFAPFPPWKDWSWYAQVWLKILERPLKLPVNVISLLWMAAGVYSLLRRNWQVGLAISSPVILTLAASGLQKYPFGERMLLFLMPVFLISLAEGIDLLRQIVRKLLPPLAWFVFLVPVAFYLYTYTSQNIRSLPLSAQGEHIKPLLVHLHEQVRPRDRIYVYYGSKPAFLYYSQQLGLELQNTLLGSSKRKLPEAYLQEIESFAAGSRVWVLFSHNCSWCMVNEEAYIVDYLDQIGKRKEAIIGNNASMYLYDLR